MAYDDHFMDGWESVRNQFPSANTEIEEASKCFALDRYTAVVFHLMRIMEIGLRSLSSTLKDPSLDPKRNPNWEGILAKCRTEQSKPLNQRAPEWQADEPFFSGVSVRLMPGGTLRCMLKVPILRKPPWR